MKQKLLLLFVSLLLFWGCDLTSSSSSKSKKHVQIDSLTYVAMGASDAVGWGADPYENGYVYLIRDELTEFVDSVNFTNLGIAGLTVDELFNYECDSTISLQPDLITIWTGGNDFLALIESEMSNTIFGLYLDSLLLKITTQLPEAEIVIANLPDLAKLPQFDNADSATLYFVNSCVKSLNDTIKAKAKKYELEMVDLYANKYIENRDNISDDGFHPSNKGYQVMASEYMEIIHQFYPYE